MLFYVIVTYVVHHRSCRGDVANIDELVQSNLKVLDDLDLNGELDGGLAGRVHRHRHVVRGSLAEERTEPLLIVQGPGPVGEGKLPALVDEVVSEAEEERTVQAPGGNAAHAGLYLDGGHSLGQQRRNLGLDCLSAQPTCEGFEM